MRTLSSPGPPAPRELPHWEVDEGPLVSHLGAGLRMHQPALCLARCPLGPGAGRSPRGVPENPQIPNPKPLPAGDASRPNPVPVPEASGLQAPAGTRPVLERGLHFGAPASELGCRDPGDAARRAAVLCPADALWMVTDPPLGSGPGARRRRGPSEAAGPGCGLSCWPARPEQQRWWGSCSRRQGLRSLISSGRTRRGKAGPTQRPCVTDHMPCVRESSLWTAH